MLSARMSSCGRFADDRLRIASDQDISQESVIVIGPAYTGQPAPQGPAYSHHVPTKRCNRREALFRVRWVFDQRPAGTIDTDHWTRPKPVKALYPLCQRVPTNVLGPR